MPKPRRHRKGGSSVLSLIVIAALAACASSEPLPTTRQATPRTDKPRMADSRACLPSGQVPAAVLNAHRPAPLKLAIDVDASGKVTAITVVESSGYKEVDQYWRATLAKCQYLPAQAEDGSPKAGTLNLTHRQGA